jgi:hypothetical protein
MIANSSDDLVLLDLKFIFIKYKKTMLLVLMLSWIVFFFLYLILPRQYNASAVLHIGQVAWVQVEPIYVVKERLTDPAFFSQVFQKNRGLFEKESNEISFLKKLNVERKKDAPNLLSLNLSANDSGLAKSQLNAIVNELIEIHKLTYDEKIESRKKQLALIDKQIRVLRDSSSLDSCNALCNAASNFSMQSRELENKRIIYLEEISKGETFNTKTLNGILIVNKPFSPDFKRLFLIVNFIGVFLGFFIALLRNALVR